MKVKYIVYTILVLGIGALIYYRISSNKEQKKEPGGGGPKQPMAVSGMVVAPEEFSNVLSLSGFLLKPMSRWRYAVRYRVLPRGSFLRKGRGLPKGRCF
jgi:hypothetical protein